MFQFGWRVPIYPRFPDILFSLVFVRTNPPILENKLYEHPNYMEQDIWSKSKTCFGGIRNQAKPQISKLSELS